MYVVTRCISAKGCCHAGAHVESVWACVCLPVLSPCSGGFFVRGGADPAEQAGYERAQAFLREWYDYGELHYSLNLDWRMHDQVWLCVRVCTSVYVCVSVRVCTCVYV